MRPRTRLDPVVKVEEQKEELSLRALGEAGRELASAEQHLARARAHAGGDARRSASASDWQLADLAHARALLDVRTAEHAVQSAASASAVSRDRYAAAHSRAEAIRRAADARAGEILVARATAETRELDEIGALVFSRRDAA